MSSDSELSLDREQEVEGEELTKCTLTYENGVFEGHYVIKKHGHGKYEWNDGRKYVG